MEIILSLLLAAAFFVLSTVPGLLLASVGWRLSQRISNHQTRNVIRAGLVSVAIAPTPYGHGGFVPAIWAVLFPPVRGKTDVTAIIALLLIWLIALFILLRRTEPRIQI